MERSSALSLDRFMSLIYTKGLKKNTVLLNVMAQIYLNWTLNYTFVKRMFYETVSVITEFLLVQYFGGNETASPEGTSLRTLFVCYVVLLY